MDTQYTAFVNVKNKINYKISSLPILADCIQGDFKILKNYVEVTAQCECVNHTIQPYTQS